MTSVPTTDNAETGADVLRLFHQRDGDRGGALGPRDEEECFTSGGRRVGVWLSTEVARGPASFAADIAVTAVAGYEVTAAGDRHRTFVVPGNVVKDLGFVADPA